VAGVAAGVLRSASLGYIAAAHPAAPEEYCGSCVRTHTPASVYIGIWLQTWTRVGIYVDVKVRLSLEI
jgi:hypothetical protein